MEDGFNIQNIPYQEKKGQDPQDHLIKCRKATDKIQHSFVIKTLNKLGIESNFFKLIKEKMKKITTANIILNGRRLNALLLKSETKTRMSVLATSI